MAVSLESRVPLLDHMLVEFLATVPPERKVAGLRPKHLLREAAARLIPEEISQNREKRGFPVPGRFWKTPFCRSRKTSSRPLWISGVSRGTLAQQEVDRLRQ